MCQGQTLREQLSCVSQSNTTGRTNLFLFQVVTLWEQLSHVWRSYIRRTNNFLVCQGQILSQGQTWLRLTMSWSTKLLHIHLQVRYTYNILQVGYYNYRKVKFITISRADITCNSRRNTNQPIYCSTKPTLTCHRCEVLMVCSCGSGTVLIFVIARWCRHGDPDSKPCLCLQ